MPRMSTPEIFQPLNTGGAISAITVGGSPYVFTAQKEGFLSVQGGTVSVVNYSRGASVVALGLINGLIPVMEGDKVTVTYLTPPVINFIPR